MPSTRTLILGLNAPFRIAAHDPAWAQNNPNCEDNPKAAGCKEATPPRPVEDLQPDNTNVQAQLQAVHQQANQTETRAIQAAFSNEPAAGRQ